MTTHPREPVVPRNWASRPRGRVQLTDNSQLECIEITIHGVEHYLHSSTARELSTMLLRTIETYNAKCRRLGMPTV